MFDMALKVQVSKWLRLRREQSKIQLKGKVKGI
jgi:hypothetical protein